MIDAMQGSDELIPIRVPGDKSISHRCLMLAPLATGTSVIEGLAPGADVAATAAAMRALGVDGAHVPADGGRLELAGPVRLRSPEEVVDCGNSGTTARLLIGQAAGRPLIARLTGDDSLRRRPMDRVTRPLREAGARIRELAGPARLPLEVGGGALRPIEHESPVASAQVKSALILAGLGAGVAVTVVEPGHSRDHTERMLAAMGAAVRTETEGDRRIIRFQPPEEPLAPLELRVPGDFSSAAYWIALALLGGAGRGVRLEGVGLNSSRTGFLKALREMGADLDVHIREERGSIEPVGEIEARPSSLMGIDVPPEWIPTLLDEIPILACLAVRAEGVTIIRGAAELRVKESDRIARLYQNLGGLGVTVREYPDGLEIEGTRERLQGSILTGGDHRISISFGVLGATRNCEIAVDDRACAVVSYPGFWDELARVAEAAG